LKPTGGADAALRRSLVRPEREQHGEFEIERVSDVPGAMKARAVPVVETLHRRGHLSARQAYAAAHIYSAWALGICCARDSEQAGGGPFDPGGYHDKQLDAAREYREIRDAVGPRLWSCLFAVVCEDFSIDRFANERGKGMDRKQWMGCLKLALDTAADHLGLPDD
jgi:hypothetical protein